MSVNSCVILTLTSPSSLQYYLCNRTLGDTFQGMDVGGVAQLECQYTIVSKVSRVTEPPVSVETAPKVNQSNTYIRYMSRCPYNDQIRTNWCRDKRNWLVYIIHIYTIKYFHRRLVSKIITYNFSNKKLYNRKLRSKLISHTDEGASRLCIL